MRRLGGERQAPLRDLTRWENKPLPWAPLTIEQIFRQGKDVVGRRGRGRGDVC